VTGTDQAHSASSIDQDSLDRVALFCPGSV